ncbi:hypothetical protein F5Y14DRAFT_449275 [Nemania sp. NC0429]|nr:hypothetical protein F5Y14DRAFT_449275 [Nemania sp. NC0429]
MEALVALGLAANIAQFIFLAGKAVIKTYELAISEKRLLHENEELDIIAHDFSLALPAIRTAATKATHGQNDESLELLAVNALAISEDIERLLGAVKAQRSKRKRSANLFATLRELGLLDELKSLNGRLSGLLANR